MTKILSGREVRESRTPVLMKAVQDLGFKPVLAIIQVGDQPDSNAFIRAKQNFANKIGVETKLLKVSASVGETELRDIIRKCNADRQIKGIVVQLPLPLGLDRDTIIETISPAKDVDGLTSFNVKRWISGREDALWPATARGVRELLEYFDISLFGKKVTVIGRSMLVGKPIIAMCLNENATVTVCHSKTADLAKFTKISDVIIVAAGRPNLIGPRHVHKKMVVIDVGINTALGKKLDEEIVGSKLVGDVNFEKVQKLVSAITPVPGGVGPMTVLALFQNLVDLCRASR